MLLYFSSYGIAYSHHEHELLITRLCQQSSFKSWMMMCSILAIMTCIYKNGLFTLLSQSLNHPMLHKRNVYVFIVKHTLGKDASSTLISLLPYGNMELFLWAFLYEQRLVMHASLFSCESGRSTFPEESFTLKPSLVMTHKNILFLILFLT